MKPLCPFQDSYKAQQGTRYVKEARCAPRLSWLKGRGLHRLQSLHAKSCSVSCYAQL